MAPPTLTLGRRAAGLASLAGAALACLILAGCSGGDDEQAGPPGGPPGGPGGGGGPPPSLVRVGNASVETVQRKRRLTGNLRAKQRGEVAVVEPGRVVAVEFDEGQSVAEGDVLIRVDDRRIREDLSAAEAEVAVAEARQIQRGAELERVRSDLESRESAARQASGAVSETELRQARTDVAVAESLVNAAEKEVNAARTRTERFKVALEDTTVRAPFAGRVVERMAELGMFMSAGSAVADLASEGEYEAVVDVPEDFDAGHLERAGAGGVSVELAGSGRRLDVSGVRVVDDVDPRSRRFMVVADVTAPEGSTRLASGMSVTATLSDGETATRTVVPYNAVQQSEVGPYVLMVVDGGMGGPGGKSAAPVRVRVDYREGERAILAEGAPLPPDATLVVEGGERVMPGMPVRVADAPGAPPTTNPAQALAE